MPPSRRRLSAALLLIGLISATALTAFEITIAIPALERVRSTLKLASPGELAPPPALREMLDSAHGDTLKFLVARQVLSAHPSLVAEMGTSQRQLLEILTGLTLTVHLSRTEIVAAYLSPAYMGPGVQGFERAAANYLGKEVAHLSREEAARLVAIAQAPQYFLADPARLQLKIQILLNHAE